LASRRMRLCVKVMLVRRLFFEIYVFANNDTLPCPCVTGGLAGCPCGLESERWNSLRQRCGSLILSVDTSGNLCGSGWRRSPPVRAERCSVVLCETALGGRSAGGVVLCEPARAGEAPWLL